MAVYFNNVKLSSLKFNDLDINIINFNGKNYKLIDTVTASCTFNGGTISSFDSSDSSIVYQNSSRIYFSKSGKLTLYVNGVNNVTTYKNNIQIGYTTSGTGYKATYNINITAGEYIRFNSDVAGHSASFTFEPQF